MRKRIVFITCLILSLLLITTGLLLYSNNKDKLSGIYVRRVYGSLGNLDNNEVLLNYEVYNFGNSNQDFLREANNLTFNTSDAVILSTNISFQNKEKDLKIYDLEINVAFNTYGSIHIKELQYKNEDSEIILELGDLVIKNLDQERLSLNHAVDSSFYSNEGCLSFTGSNPKDFTILELLYESPNIDNVKVSSNKKYIAGKSLELVFDIEYSVNQYDELIFLPIVKLEEDDIYYFTPGSYISSYEGLTYVMVKEYVKCLE